MSELTIQTLAQSLDKALKTQQAIAPIREDIERIAAATNTSAIEVAYAIQNEVTAMQLQQGARLVGRKIGLTSKSVQQQLGVDEPDFGSLFAHMAYGSGDEIAINQWIQPKVEAEIALVLDRDLTHEHHTLADLINATAYVLPAIEIVDSRIQNWDISLLDTVADNASGAAFILGTQPVKLSQMDLARCGMIMTSQGEEASVGAGAACLGNPLNAAVWLANTMVRLNTPLKAGDILLSGALGPMATLKSEDAIRVDIEGLSQVTARFTKG